MHKHTRWIVSLLLAIAVSLSAMEPALASDSIEPDSCEPAALADGAVCPTYQEAYERMIALKATYPEGTPWTNFTPYGRDGKADAYWWKGGKVKGASGGVGCAAFVFILSDEAFGDLPSRTIDRGGFQYEDIKPGDILRVDGNSHFVIVLQTSSAGITVAEGNYNKSVHWGRAISRQEAMTADFLVTRYPVGFISGDDPEADTIVVEGTEAPLSWTLTKAGTLTISGSGAMPDFSAEALPSWMAHNDSISTIVIEEGVTSIGAYAFYQSKALGVYIPDGVESIGESAFNGAKIVGVTIPGSVQTIGNNAFFECPNLASATVSEGVGTIGDNAFRGCTSLQYIDFPSTITSVGSGAFMDCTKMTRVRFMPGSESVAMGSGLFARCQYLMDVTLPQTADCISDNMFSSCTLLSSIYIPVGVSEIGENPFTSTGTLTGGIVIRFGGSEEYWKAIGGERALITAVNATIEFNAPFDDPFAPIPGDNNDNLVGDGEETPDNKCEHGNDPDTCEICHPPKPTHKHAWSAVWTYDAGSHWHECGGADCTITSNSGKDGYGGHTYGSWVTDVYATAVQDGSRHRDCTVCSYRQTDSIPATGDPSDGSGGIPGDPGGNPGNPGGSPGDSGSSPESPDDIQDNPGGSSGTNTDGSGKPENTEPEKNGPVTTTTTDQSTGITTETTKNPDGSSTVTVTQKDGTTATTSTSPDGKVELEVRLAAAAVSDVEHGGPVALPVPEIEVARDIAAAPPITVSTETGGPVKVAVPAVSPTAGAVAVIVHADGSSSVVKTSVLVDGSIVVPLPGDATIKIIDNSKSFSDVAAGTWAGDAVAFVSARELFSGTTETTFDPDIPMTRAMLMTVLARFDGEDTSGGETWYEQGVEWAIRHGISDGTSLDSEITREQLVTMLWRYLGSPAPAGAISGYTDAGQISGYAQEAMCWAVENGIISGFSGGLLGPQGLATRAQVAQILKNYTESIAIDRA